MYDLLFFFFFKQKTAYEMRISDWSSDVCSSDLAATIVRNEGGVITSYDGDRVMGVFVGESQARSEEHTSELQSLMRISYAVFCLKTKLMISYILLTETHRTKIIITALLK